ncbi:hypothetical protein ACE6H2_009922 [Prunus campanulata]
MYLEVAKVLETKVSTKEEPPKPIVLCSRCQYEVTPEVVPSKPKKLTKEPTKGLIKEQPKDKVQVGRPRSFERIMITNPAENYSPHSPRGKMKKQRPKLPPVPLSKTQTRRAQRQYATTCKAELEWADKGQAQLDRLVEPRDELRLEELELAKADTVASLDVASTEEMKIR